MGQRGQCSISRDLGTLCEAEMIWDKDDDNTSLETFACSKFYWLVTEFSNLSGVLCEILAFSLHPTFVLAQNYYPVSLLVITAGRLNDRITKWIRLEGTSGSHLVLPHCSGRFTWNQLPRNVSKWLLNISKNGDSTTFTGNLFLVLGHPTVK